MEVSEDVIDRDVTLTVLLPEGTEETTTVHGSKPVMDVLVALCGEYHLNPSDHAMELLSPNQNLIKFKPNSLIGSLEAERVVLRHKGEEDKSKKRCPYVPEVSVRLMILYRTTHRAVVRVSPKVPLSELLPAICDKCEFAPETTLLFLSSQSEEPLDLTKSLNDHGIREVFAKDTKVINLPEPVATPETESSKENKLPPAKEKNAKGKENKGFLNFFRIAKKKPQKGVSASAPTTPLFHKHRALSLGFLSSRCSGSLPSDKSKKRRAPLPPMLDSLSYPANLNASTPALSTQEFGKEITLRRVSSTESTLKRTKRRAPPPPDLPQPPSPPADTAPEDSIPQDAAGNLAPVRELPEEPDLPSALKKGESIRHLTTALVHPAMNGTGANQCEELHSNELCEESCCVCAEREPEKAERLREPASSSQASLSQASSSQDSPSQAAPSPRKPSAPYRHASLSLASSSGRPLRSGGSMREGLTTFTVIPKQRERRQRTYEVQVVLESQPQQRGSDQPGSSEGHKVGNVESSSRSTGNVEHKAEDSESTDKGGTNSSWVHRGEAPALEPREDQRPPAMMPKPSRGVPFWAAQRTSVGHSSLMEELQRRVPVFIYQSTEEEEEEKEEEERRDEERQEQGEKSVEKDEVEKGKEDRVKDEREEKGGASIEEVESSSNEERMDQEIEKEEEEGEEEHEKEEMEQEEGEEKGEDDEGFDGSEKESTETDEEGGVGGEEEGKEKEKEDEAVEEEEIPPPPVIWKECDGVSKYSPSEAKHYPVDLPSAPALALASTPGPCSSSRLPVSESPSVGGLSLFALAVSQRAQRLSQAFNACASPRTLSTRIQQYRPGHMSPSSNGSVPADLH